MNIDRNKAMSYYFLNYLYANKRYENRSEGVSNKIIEFKPQTSINNRPTVKIDNQVFEMSLKAVQTRRIKMDLYTRGADTITEKTEIDIIPDATYINMIYAIGSTDPSLSFC